MNVASALWETAARGGDRPAVIESGRTVTYAELRGRGASVSAALDGAGVERGDRVAVLLERGADAAAAFFGATAAGAIAVMVNDVLKPRQIEYRLEHCGAAVLVTRPDLLARLPRALETSARIIATDSLPDAPEREPVTRLGADAAQIIYTSGSTGQPKGVTISHANLRAGLEAVRDYLGLTPDDRIAGLLPFSFDYGLNQLLCAVGTGAALVVARSPVPQRTVATLREKNVTVLAGVPALWLQLLRAEDLRERPVPSLRVMTNTGGRLPTHAVRALRRAQPQARLFLMYGLTEAFRSTFLPPHEVDDRPDSIGCAIPGTDVLVLDEDGAPCAPDEVGELVHRGPTVALGYWDDPEATARVFRPHPARPAGVPAAERVVYSGDLVRRDEEGFLYFVGRRDRMIKTMGYRVSPDEIVATLYASDEVEEAVITSEPDALRGERTIAHVVLAEGGSLDGLEQFCRIELPHHLRPARIEVHDRLPRTATGKHAVPASRGAR